MSAHKKIKEILESDDELPTTYKDISFVPVYQDDNRFHDIAIFYLTQNDSEQSRETSVDTSSSQEFEDALEIESTDSKENSTLLKGVLSRKDAYCIKVFGTVYNDETLLWFINFLVAKDMQSDHNFLISCLASDIIDYKGSNDNIANNYNRKRKDCHTTIKFEYK